MGMRLEHSVLGRAETAIARVRERVRGILMEEVGICGATNWIVSLIDADWTGRHIRTVAAASGVAPSTAHSRWHRAGLSPGDVIRQLKLIEACAVLADERASTTLASCALGASSPGALQRSIRLYTGAGPSALRTQSVEPLLEAWRTYLRACATQLRSVDVAPSPIATARAALIDARRLQLALAERRVEVLRQALQEVA